MVVNKSFKIHNQINRGKWVFGQIEMDTVGLGRALRQRKIEQKSSRVLDPIRIGVRSFLVGCVCYSFGKSACVSLVVFRSAGLTWYKLDQRMGGDFIILHLLPLSATGQPPAALGLLSPHFLRPKGHCCFVFFHHSPYNRDRNWNGNLNSSKPSGSSLGQEIHLSSLPTCTRGIKLLLCFFFGIPKFYFCNDYLFSDVWKVRYNCALIKFSFVLMGNCRPDQSCDITGTI